MKNKHHLIYDDQCAFCTGLASWFNRITNVRIVPLSMIQSKERRLHFIDLEKNTEYYDAEACLHVISLIPYCKILAHVYFWPLVYLWDALYFILKKLRRLM
jgi:predicted DCC family thiol-disulfide oxidoreductase YuxK